jgi:hypothetical protein
VKYRNGGLQSVGTEAVRHQSALGERDTFGDLVSVPQRAILLIEQDEVSPGELRAARRDSWSNMSASRPMTSGSGRSSRSSLPRRIASLPKPARVASVE